MRVMEKALTQVNRLALCMRITNTRAHEHMGLISIIYSICSVNAGKVWFPPHGPPNLSFVCFRQWWVVLQCGW